MSDCSTCACRASLGRATGSAGSRTLCLSLVPAGWERDRGSGSRSGSVRAMPVPQPRIPARPGALPSCCSVTLRGRGQRGHGGGTAGPGGAEGSGAGGMDAGAAVWVPSPAGGRRHLPAAPEQRPPLPAGIFRRFPALLGLLSAWPGGSHGDCPLGLYSCPLLQEKITPVNALCDQSGPDVPCPLQWNGSVALAPFMT